MGKPPSWMLVPDTWQPVEIIAPTKYFLKDYGFSLGRAGSPLPAVATKAPAARTE
jgi:hypothetical protein